MTCPEHKERVSIWFDGYLDESAFQATFDHLTNCSECRAFMARIPRQALLVRSLRASGVGDTDHHPNRRSQDGSPPPTTARLNLPLAAAAAILLILLTIAVERNLSGQNSDGYLERPVPVQVPHGEGMR